MATFPTGINTPMHAPARKASIPSSHARGIHAALSASAWLRLIWAAGALVLLWATIRWAIA